MCIVNRTFNFVFVHIPKCGGTSLTFALSHLNSFQDLEIGSTPYGELLQNIFFKRYGIKKHSTSQELRNTMGHSEWTKFYSFALVRNPYARTLSIFSYLKKHQDTYPFVKKFDNVNEFVLSHEWKSHGPDRMFNPQHTWMTDQGKLIVGDFFKLEEISSNLTKLGANIGLSERLSSKLTLPHRNKVRENPHEIQELTPQSEELIRTRYLEDFKMFGYPTFVSS